MRYILIDHKRHDEFTQEFDDLGEAIKAGQYDWDRMTNADKKLRSEYYVLESVNPDEDAPDHYDGNPVYDWMEK